MSDINALSGSSLRVSGLAGAERERPASAGTGPAGLDVGLAFENADGLIIDLPPAPAERLDVEALARRVIDRLGS